MEALLPQHETQAERRFQELAREGMRRECEALRMYRSMPTQLPFHLSKASERMIRGGLRSGKTTAAAVEVASAVTGVPLHDPEGNEIPFQYTRGEPLMVWIIGWDEKHISRIHKKLFKPDLFRIVKDKDTKQWRTWRPWEKDEVPYEQTKPSPPLIPERFCEPNGWAWDGKVSGCFTLCRLKNGTEIHTFSSGAEAARGEAVHIIWIDEDIKRPEHVAEWQGRLTDKHGRLIWSAWPNSVNEAMVSMTDRAEAQRDRENPDVFEIVLIGSENPYMPQDEIRKRLEGWGSEVSRSRDRGEYLRENQLVFPHFNIRVHGVKGTGCPKKLADELARLNYLPGPDWTNYLAIDPGTAHAAVLFATVPPPEFGDHVVFFDEIYGERYLEDALARIISERYGKLEWEAFIIDDQYARQVQGTSGMSTKVFLAEAFKRFGLKSARTQNGFAKGSKDTNGRNAILRGWMQPRSDGTTKMICVEHKTVWLQKQMRLYKLMVQQTEAMDKVKRKDNDMCDDAAYIAAYDPEWVKRIESKAKELTNAEWLAGMYRDIGFPQSRSDRGCFLAAGAVSAGEAAWN